MRLQNPKPKNRKIASLLGLALSLAVLTVLAAPSYARALNAATTTAASTDKITAIIPVNNTNLGTGKVTVVFQVLYAGAAPGAFTFDCGNSAQGQQSNPPAVTGNAYDYRYLCNYDIPTLITSSFTVTAAAWNNSGGKLAEKTYAFNLDSEGRLTPKASDELDDPFRVVVSSFLSPIFMAIQAFLFMFYWALIMPFIIAASSIQTGIGSCTAAGGTDFLANICNAWEIVRNLVNMIFILIMIVIGISTILGLQSYNYKKLLGKLIIMALLVNFSLVIAQAVLKLADILQFTFMPADSVWQLSRLGYQLIAFHIVTVGGTDPLAAIGQAIVVEVTQIPVLAAELLNLSLSFLAFVVMGAIAVFLLIRLVALWILLILSPLAYALMVVPAVAGLAKTWWTTFFKYAFFTPILFFFMRISVEMSDKPFFGQIPDGCRLLTAQAANQACPAGMGMFTTFVYNTLQQVVVVAFLFGALTVAQKLSIAGGAAMANLGQKGMMLPLAGAGFLGGAAVGAGGRWYSGAVGRRIAHAIGEGKEALKTGDKAGAAGFFKKADRYKALGMLNPVVAKQAWEARKKEKDFEAYSATSGHARDFLNRYMPTEWHTDEEGKAQMGQETYYGRIGEKAIINHKKKEWEEANLSEEEKNRAMRNAVHPYDLQALGELHIEGRHEDGRRIEEGVIAQKARIKEIIEDLKSKGNDQDAAEELALQQLEKEAEAGGYTGKDGKFVKLPAAAYDAVADWIHDTDMYKAKGLSAGQVGDIGSAQSELGEKERKIRALGQEVHLGNRFFSTADPEYLKAIQEEQGTTAMLKKLRELKIDGMEVTDEKILKDAGGNDITRMNAETGRMEPVKVPAELSFNGQKITDFDSLSKAIEATSVEKGASYGSGNNLRYELAGALKAESAEKRIMRGNTEEWGAAFEPAAWMEQTPDGFTRFTSFGKRMIRSLSAAQVNSFEQSRRMQARAMKMGGFYVDHQSGETELKNPQILDELFELNRDLGIGLMGKGNFTQQQANDMAEKLNKLVGETKYKYGGKSARGGHYIDFASGPAHPGTTAAPGP